MGDHSFGCMVCGAPLTYAEQARELPCAVCGQKFMTNAACEAGHFVCDTCHSRGGLEGITAIALSAREKNPVAIAQRMMRAQGVHMHGPEHHYIVPAALLCAYKNAGGEVELEKALAAARERSAQVPGGVCGFWGGCGAALGAGIFASIVTGATPLSVEEWSLANRMSARCLESIADAGGPRCCKRDSFTALTTAAQCTAQWLGVEMELPQELRCGFFAANGECKKAGCAYYPAKPKIS